VGGSEALRCQARLVAATNRDLAAMVAAGAFREDLYYRLEVFVVHLPPLRERQEDIELLALYFLHRTAAHLHKPQLTGIAPAALQALQQHPWPGNVRELEHVVQRAVIVGAGPILEVDDLALAPALPAGPTTYTPPLSPGFESLAEHERRYIEQVLAHTGQVIKGPRGAAEFLGIPRSTLYSRMRKLGIARPSPSDSPASARS
jgi:DNA-binding NtrC family response regulator